MKTQLAAATAAIGKKTKVVSGTLLATAAMISSSAHAALDQGTVDGIVTEVTADAGIAITAGFSVLGVVLAASIGFSLLGRFISKGANGG